MIEAMKANWYIFRRNLNLRRSLTIEGLLILLAFILVPILPLLYLFVYAFRTEIWSDIKSGNLSDAFGVSFVVGLVSIFFTAINFGVWYLPYSHFDKHEPDKFYVKDVDKTYYVQPRISHWIGKCDATYKVSSTPHPKTKGNVIRSNDDRFDCDDYTVELHKMPRYEARCFKMVSEQTYIKADSLPKIIVEKATKQQKELIANPQSYCDKLLPERLF